MSCMENISKGQVTGIYIQETISILIFEVKTSLGAMCNNFVGIELD